MINWKIGCSGFYYAEWKDLFYPRSLAQRKWFEFYCEHFKTVELNTTFYRFPRVEYLQKWYEKSPADFSFTVKAPRLITHYKRFNDAQKMIGDFYEASLNGLREKLGCMLFQFPSAYNYSEQRLEQILGMLDRSFMNVLEFRHESWWNESIFKILADNNISFSGMSHPTLPTQVVSNNHILYYRFHGVPHLYHSAYEMNELEDFLHSVQNIKQQGEAYVYFNNTAEGSAVGNAKQLIAIAADMALV